MSCRSISTATLANFTRSTAFNKICSNRDGPSEFGESRFDTVRAAFLRPLGVQFDVLEDVQTVIVYDAWRIDAK
jgi:hypothetical protein